MGTAPLTADQMLAALTKWNIKPKFYKSDWRTHNRNGGGRLWGGINGFLVHNFASDISDASSLAYLYNGDAARELPGPLSQFALDDLGDVWIIGWGRANHGGKGDQDSFNAMVDDTLPLDRDFNPDTNSGPVDMNAHSYGCEMLYGNNGPTAAQRKMIVRLCAAMMDAHGYDGTSVAGHREFTTNRSDPQGIPNMGTFRKEVIALLKAGPGSTATPAPTPTPTQENEMQLTDKVALRTDGSVDYSSTYTTVEGILQSTNYYVLERTNKIIADLSDQKVRDEAILAAVKGDDDTATIVAAIETHSTNLLAAIPAAVAAALSEVPEASADEIASLVLKKVSDALAVTQ